MTARRTHTLMIWILALAGPPALAGRVAAQDREIGTIDYYGLRTISRETVDSVLQLKPGDLQPHASRRASIMRRLKEIPGVLDADLSWVCCRDGTLSVYVGIAEDSTAILEFRPAPTSIVPLPDEMLASDRELDRTMVKAITGGNTRDDMSQGHSLMADSAARAVQERYLVYAAEQMDTLRAVLRGSSDAEHRAIAAQVIGYAADKREVIDDLVYAARDPDDGVRNDATRALAAISFLANKRPDLGIRISAGLFVEMLRSVSWSDRNKASALLTGLTEGRDPETLGLLREEAYESLVEMARWQGTHAFFAVVLLGRVAGLPDEELMSLWPDGDKEPMIDRAIQAIRRQSGTSS